MSVFDEELGMGDFRGDKSFQMNASKHDISYDQILKGTHVKGMRNYSHDSLHTEKIRGIHDPETSLAKLRRENASLRMQLKELNEQIDTVISSAPVIKERLPGQHREFQARELETAKKRLDLYTKERNKLLSQVEKLNNSKYIEDLERTIKQQMRTVSEYEKKIKRSKNEKLNREKALETVLDTGITPNIVRENTNLAQEISFYQHKVTQLENKIHKLEKYSEKLEIKHEKLKADLSRLQAERGEIVSDNTETLDKLKQVNDEYQSWIKSYNNRMSKLRIKVTQNERDLANTSQLISFYSSQLVKKSQDLPDLSKAKSSLLLPRINLSSKSVNSSISSTNLYLTESKVPIEEEVEVM